MGYPNLIMKYILPILFLFSSVLCKVTVYEDVVYLKDGSVIRGMIIEQVPNRHIKIKSGESIVWCQMDDIERITKEINTGPSLSSDISDKTISIAAGVSTNKNLNVVQLTKDFKFSKKWAFFIGVGYSNVLVLGLAAQSNYNNSGVIFGYASAIDFIGEGRATMSLGYQWRINDSNIFFTLGGGYGNHLSDLGGDIKVTTYLYPVISLDMRFYGRRFH